MKPILPLLVCMSIAAAPAFAASDCAALQIEVETLRARVRVLEASLVTAAPAPAPTPALPGTATRPAATAVVVVEEPYSRSGCSRGFFKGIEPAKWQEADLWLELAKGQTPAEVEKLLGVEHYDERGGSNVIWHYGRCGVSSRAQVLFTNGKLSDWRAPTN